MFQTKNKSIETIYFSLLVISSKKRVNNGKKWRNTKYGGVADENSKKYIISIILEHKKTCYKQKIRVLRQFIFPRFYQLTPYWGPYMASALLMSLVVIWQFLIWFFCMASFNVCVDGLPTSCGNILALCAPLIYRLWKHDLLLSTVLRNV